MHRQVRRVPAHWEHPKNEDGYIELEDVFSYTKEEIEEGLSEGWLKNEPPHYGCKIMPDWPEAEKTHYQMYETTTPGTPISPVMETPGALAQWLTDNKETLWTDFVGTYEDWLSIINGKSTIQTLIGRRT